MCCLFAGRKWWLCEGQISEYRSFFCYVNFFCWKKNEQSVDEIEQSKWVKKMNEWILNHKHLTMQTHTNRIYNLRANDDEKNNNNNNNKFKIHWLINCKQKQITNQTKYKKTDILFLFLKGE